MQKTRFVLSLVLLILANMSTSFAAQLETHTVKLNTQTLPKNGVRVPFLQIDLQSTDDNLEIKSLTIARTGLSGHEDFGRIWAETDHYRRSTSRQLSSDDQVTLEFRNPLQIKSGQSERLTIYANLEFKSSGRTAALNLVKIEYNDTTIQTHNANQPAKKSAINLKQIPVVTQSQSQYDRTRFKIRCKNQVCRLVPRN